MFWIKYARELLWSAREMVKTCLRSLVVLIDNFFFSAEELVFSSFVAVVDSLLFCIVIKNVGVLSFFLAFLKKRTGSIDFDRFSYLICLACYFKNMPTPNSGFPLQIINQEHRKLHEDLPLNDKSIYRLKLARNFPRGLDGYAGPQHRRRTRRWCTSAATLTSTSKVKGQVWLTLICNTSLKVDGDFGSDTDGGGLIKVLRSVEVALGFADLEFVQALWITVRHSLGQKVTACDTVICSQRGSYCYPTCHYLCCSWIKVINLSSEEGRKKDKQEPNY